MSIKLSRMNEEAFNQYYNIAIQEYANEHVKAGNWGEEEAFDNAKKQFAQLLPDGLETKAHVLFSIMYDNEIIGTLWLNIQSKQHEKHGFIYDIKLDVGQRGKGYGKATMAALEEYAKSENINQISLHVFAHNERAVALYEKMGYEAKSYNMSKKLS